MAGKYKYKDVLGLVDKNAKGFYLPWWMLAASKKCLLQFFYIRERKYDIVEKRVVLDSTLLGTGVHAGMEWLTRGESIGFCCKKIAEEMREVDGGQRSVISFNLILKEALYNFKRTVQIITPWRGLQSVSENPVIQQYNSLRVACRVDNLEVVDKENKVVDIWDYKCSKHATSVQSAQLRFNIACIELAGWHVRNAHFILPCLGSVKRVKVPKNPLKILAIAELAIIKINEIGDFPPNPNRWNCGFCNFAARCPHAITHTDLSCLKEGTVDF